MLNIAFSLLGGLILSWFGFVSVVQTGMHDVFHETISTTGYYFLFGFVGALRSIFASVNNNPSLKLNKKKDS